MYTILLYYIYTVHGNCMNKILHLIAQSLSESSSLISSRIGLVQFPFLSSSFVNRSSSSPIASFSGESLKRLSTNRVLSNSYSHLWFLGSTATHCAAALSASLALSIGRIGALF